MTWLRIDDRFPTNPKIGVLSDRAFRLHVTGLCYSAEHLTDGFVPAFAIRWTTRAMAELVEGGLWLAQIDPRGWWIHDYLEYNPSRSQVEAERSKKQAAGRAGGLASGQARAEASASRSLQEIPNPDPTPNVTANAVTPPARTVEQRGNDLATAYYDVQPLSNFPAIALIARKAIKAGHPDEAIRAALLRLADEGRGVTTESLRVELEGLPAQRSLRHHDRAAEILKGALSEPAAG